ncbi:MAG: phage holin family protein [Muribaculum sp.]
MSERNDDLKASWANVREWGKLYFENLRLLSIEKATVLFSQGIMGVLLVILCACAFFFISIALVLILAQVLPVMWCFLIMGGVYLLLGLAVYIFRKPLLTDPIARFLSRLFLENPEVSSQPSNDEKQL